MIDVSHPTAADLSHHFAPTNHDRQGKQDTYLNRPSGASNEEPEDEEIAWLRSVQAVGDASILQVKGLQSGPLVIDIGQLREESQSHQSR